MESSEIDFERKDFPRVQIIDQNVKLKSEYIKLKEMLSFLQI